jgi:hypothetical protein
MKQKAHEIFVKFEHVTIASRISLWTGPKMRS